MSAKKPSQPSSQQQWPSKLGISNEFMDVPASSVLYSVIPSSVRRRLPRFPSMSKSGLKSGSRTSLFGKKSIKEPSDSASSSNNSSGATTPVPTYTSPMAMTTSTARPNTADIEAVRYFEERLVAIENRPSSADSIRGSTLVIGNGSGIDWRFAAQGRNLLNSALEESMSAPQHVNSDPTFTRQLYIHSMTYFLRGLPPNLNAEEQLSLQSALPPGIAQPIRLEIDNANMLAYQDFQGRIGAQRKAPASQSFLHRTLANLIVQLFIIFQFLLPHIKVFLHSAYIYERNNRISEKVLARSIDTVDAMGKKSIEFGEAVAKIGNGRLGNILNRCAVWCIEGVVGGVYDGVGEGMILMGAVPPRGI